MLKKMLLLLAMSLTFFAASPMKAGAENPLPECDPCPWVK